MHPESTSQMAKSPDKPQKLEKSQAELRADFELRFRALESPIEQGAKEYQKALDDGTFDDNDGEPVGSGDKRKEDMQKKLTAILDRAEKMKEILDSGEELPQEPVLDIESLKLQNQPFLKETFKKWYDEEKSKVEQKPTLVKPEDQDYSILKDDIDKAKFGEYTLNPDTQNLDFEHIPESKILSPDLSSLNGKPLHEVAKYIIDTYSTTHHIPGLEYYKWLYENPQKAPTKLKDGNYYFNFGSLVRSSGGYWRVPFARWGGSGWYRFAGWLGSSWRSFCRVVLLEI